MRLKVPLRLGADPEYFVESVVAARRTALENSSETASDAVSDGRLLAYVPSASVSDGASEQATQGFLDVDDAPPWDTWVTYIKDDTEPHGYIASWIPIVFVPLVDEGIRVNAMDCIWWLESRRPRLHEQLIQLD
jgi:hypothetical protein